jgi:hypothetical protein
MNTIRDSSFQASSSSNKDSGGGESSSRSSEMFSKNNALSMPPEEFILDGLKLTSIPAMSSDGMQQSKFITSNKEFDKYTAIGTENEEEFAVV